MKEIGKFKRQGCTGSKEEKRDQGKRRETWEGIKHLVGLCVLYCENSLLPLATI